VAFFLLLKNGKSGLFNAPRKICYLLRALVVAVDNFQFAAYFSGKMQPLKADFADWILFISYCFLTGLFEETIFRGVIFTLLADRFEKNKKGLLKTIILSSFIFGLAHLFNLFTGGGVGVFLQVCYSTLTGALFAFVLIKTKNVICCAVVHGLYNFCGLLFSAKQGLGAGVVLDLPTGLTMFIVSVIVAGFAVYSFTKYREDERKELYSRLGFGIDSN
jgi:membrane protease YdiL (CAAX protease family)